ncbi:GntR family transcriptional regulator [Carnobacterium maltaromaticum]|uniref:GntR family transcriptional regulator n=1 Tax=Carnobacterium maltaromaticum TaxID=2751 RepID=UPI00295EB320|nr:GntR family transcriptional regulator [Carnobacterium maltaromaticum]
MSNRLIKSPGAAPLYNQISDDLRFKILAGQWDTGEKIPPELELCELYHVSRITVRKAIDELVREGYLYRERAKGTFVLSLDGTTEKQHYTMVQSFTKEMQELGKTATTLSATVELIRATPKLAKQLNISTNSKVLQLRRVRGTDGQAFAYFITSIPYVADFSLDSQEYYGSFYDYLASFGIVINEFKEYVEAVVATDELQSILQVSEHTPLLKRVRMTFQTEKNFHEFSECYYIGNKYRYYVDINKQ